VLDMAAGKPLTATVILHDLGLPADVTATVQEASLNSALAADKRFDDVSLNDTPAWILKKTEPAEVRERPVQLEPALFAGTVTVGESLETLASRIDDELDFELPEAQEPADSATCILTYAHRAAGTLGLSRGLAAVLQTPKPRIPVTLKDRASGREFIVWLVREGRYVWGLSEFYRSADLPAGAEITVSRTAQHDVFQIDARKRKPKREWVRVASRANDGRLRLETAQRAVSCEFDDLMSAFVDSNQVFGGVYDVAGAVRDVFPEIAKLSPQGNVHARTLYAVVNVLTRASARNVFAALVASGSFVAVGDDYWHIGER
jgi:hypothetical protein